MTARALINRRLADNDIADAIDHYRREAGQRIALNFVAALERALEDISGYPDAGSPRYGHELGLPGLRSWTLRGFPYLIFYVRHDDRIDVWRVLHGHRDIPERLRDDPI